MPKVSDQFGPIYQSVVLNASGTGTVTFQAQGSAVRISNIFFNVSTSTAQAVCTIYKGFVAVGNIVFNSNSGSTGGNAKGNVDLFDGETCYVVWTGGDVGATATATFTGQKVNFSEIKSSELTFDDPIAAGDGSLIYPALKSPNYVAGTTGWQIDRTGNADFNDVSVRGTLIVTGNNNSQITVWNPGTGIPVINFRPGDLGYAPFNTAIRASIIEAESVDAGNQNDSYVRLLLWAPYLNNAGGLLSSPQISMESASYDGVTPGRLALRNANGNIPVVIEGSLDVSGLATDGNRVAFSSSSATSAAVGAEAVVQTVASATYAANSAFRVEISGGFQPSINSTATPGRPIFRVRKTNLAGAIVIQHGRLQGITLEVYDVDLYAYFQVGATAVTAALAITLASGSAAGTNDITFVGTTDRNRQIEVFYAGPATRYPNAPTLS